MLFLKHLVVEWCLALFMLLTRLILVYELLKGPKLFSPTKCEEIAILLATKKAKIYQKKQNEEIQEYEILQNSNSFGHQRGLMQSKEL